MTMTRRRCTLAALWTVTILALCVWGQSESFAQSDTVAAPTSDQTASTTTVNPDDLVRGMASLLSSAQSFTLHIEKSFDVVLTDGAKVQYSGAADIGSRVQTQLIHHVIAAAKRIAERNMSMRLS